MAAFPNPAVDVLNLTGVEHGADVRILDATGRVVLTVRSSNGPDRLSVEVSALRAGIYTVEVPGQGTLRFTKA
jgi:hypothetical protein